MRRDASPWDEVGLKQTIVGTGDWQVYILPFTSTGDISLARLDFGVAPGITIGVDSVRTDMVTAPPQQLFVDNESMTPARHPNRGFNKSLPRSPYFLVAQNSEVATVNGKPVSTYLTMGSDIVLPPGATITPGLSLRIRTHGWMLEERKVASVVGKRINLDKPTSFPIEINRGYLLLGSNWMLDEPGEWQYDSPSNVIYAWMPDGGTPGDRVAMGRLSVGIDAAMRSNVKFNGIAVTRAVVGVNLQSASDVSFQNGSVSDALNEGIDVSGSINCEIDNNVIRDTGRDAISGVSAITGRIASGLVVTRNDISASGVTMRNGAVSSVPVWSFAAIRSGDSSVVKNNSVVNSGYIGIWPLKSSEVRDNYIENACLVLDDCGGIYVGLPQNNSQITGNLVNRVIGAVEGKDVDYSQAQGIYLDHSASGVTVSGNTVIDADNGIQLHNASANDVLDNKLYGNRRNQIWMQEGSNTIRSSGDIFGNRVRGNTFVPLNGNPSILHQTVFSTTSEFASYDLNRYSTLMGPTVSLEQWSSGSASYGFTDWRAAKTPGGVPRTLESNGVQITLGANAQYRISGGNIVPNGDIAAGLSGWNSWNAVLPLGGLSLDLGPASGASVRFSGGGSPGLISTANFSVVKDRWYRVSFDMKTGADLQNVKVGVRRGGGGQNNYDWLLSQPPVITGTRTWKRYSFPMRALATVNANDPATDDKGARLDFQLSITGQQLWLANVEVAQMTPVGASLKTTILYNSSQLATSVACPDAQTEPVFCARYLRISDGAAVNWPYTLGPLASEIIFSRGDTMTDQDQDGIGDAQDACPSTTVGLSVNSKGCALGQ